MIKIKQGKISQKNIKHLLTIIAFTLFSAILFFKVDTAYACRLENFLLLEVQ
jgi:hypothetical protein